MRQTLGHAALIRGDRAAAMSLFEEARLLAPDDPAIIEDLAQVQIDMGQFGKAEQNIRELLAEKGNEDRADLRRSLIDCMLGQQRFAEARRMLETMTEAPTGADAETWLALGKVCLQMNDDRGARRASARAAALSPSWVEPHMLQAMVHRRSGAYEAALVAVDRALTIDARNASAHAIRGLVLTDMGRQAEASRAFAEAAEIDPTNPAFTRFTDPAIATVPTDGE
jgi:Flp pilus assembly protein TadD